MKMICCKVTDKGSKKIKNQDSSFAEVISSDTAFGIICDGVGSYSDSEIASTLAVNAFADWFLKCYPNISDIDDENEFRTTLYERWNSMFENINNYIIRFAEINKIKLACTLSCILIRNENYYILHIGDTRIYRISNEITKLTEDHTVAERNARKKIVTGDRAQTERNKHVLTKCLASRKNASPDFYCGTFTETTKFLICSDGFFNNADERKIFEQFGANKKINISGLKKAAEKVIRCDRKCGERDNITAVIIQASKE